MRFGQTVPGAAGTRRHGPRATLLKKGPVIGDGSQSREETLGKLSRFAAALCVVIHTRRGKLLGLQADSANHLFGVRGNSPNRRRLRQRVVVPPRHTSTGPSRSPRAGAASFGTDEEADNPLLRHRPERVAGAGPVAGQSGPTSQFEQSLALACRDWTKLIRRALMKVLGAAVIVLAVLYFADQQFAQGRYTDAVQQMAGQMMHSLGTS